MGKRNVQDTEIVLRHLSEGLTPAEISKKTGIGIRRISAIKAHLTMGRYSKSIQDSEWISFGLERDLQNHVLGNLKSLIPESVPGSFRKEVKTEVGIADIVVELKNKSLLVIELKAGLADDAALGQIIGYMSSLSQNNQPVTGMIVAYDFSERLKSGVQLVKNLKLVKYGIQFKFTDVD